jgi:4-hydroxy-tetrahydrodipicolinate synthase
VKPDLLLSGVITPIVTPLHQDRSVDHASLERLVEFEVDGGVSALFVLGTGGEGPYLDVSQREDVVASVVKFVRGRVPVVSGVSDIGTARALGNLELSVAAGVDGVVSTAPFYGEVGGAEIELHFRTLATAARGLPLYAYDIPSKVG